MPASGRRTWRRGCGEAGLPPFRHTDAWRGEGSAAVAWELGMVPSDPGIDWPAWVQAGGTVFALFLAVGLAWWEAHQRRRDIAAGDADRLEARIAVITLAAEQIRSYVDAHNSGERATRLSPGASFKASRFLIASAREVSLTDMPTPLCVQALITVQAGLIAINERLDACGNQWMHPTELDAFTKKVINLEKTVGMLKDEVQRLRG